MSQPRIDRIDHFVLTVADIDATCRFYERTLGLKRVEFVGRVALAFGRQKINLHRAGHEFEPKARRTLPGTGDFCLIAATPLDAIVARLVDCGVPIELGPVPKTGALGPMRSIYFRDPDGNLVEVANYRGRHRRSRRGTTARRSR
ncbi:MAG: VOC family protein [Alphaproteobacteria bacterium]|nr:VOC family protein [Alphaproteobacteria bacterium]